MYVSSQFPSDITILTNNFFATIQIRIIALTSLSVRVEERRAKYKALTWQVANKQPVIYIQKRYYARVCRFCHM